MKPYICHHLKTRKNTNLETKLMPPKAEKKPKQLSIHNDVRIDNYYWLREKENPEVKAYLNQENQYYAQETAHTKTFQENLFEEMKARIKEDDSSVPYKLNGYWYQVRYEKGKNYPIYSRRKENLDAKEEIIFDCNEMAKPFAYFNLNGINISPDNNYAAFGVDTDNRKFDMGK